MMPDNQDLTAALLEQIDHACRTSTPLRIRGSGSKDFYGSSLRGEVLDVSAHRGVLAYEPSELVVTVRGGTPLAELEALLAEQGQYLPFEPPHFGPAATVGGMVASGLSGPARSSVGGLRDYVLGVVLINGQGQRLRFGGQVIKNVAGYDISRLMVGALGTLGVLLEVSLKVLPRAPLERSRVFALDEASAVQQLCRWAGQALPINASYWQAGQLWLRLRGAQAAVLAAEKTLGGEACEDSALWSQLREQTLPFFNLEFGQALWRLSVPDDTAPLNLGPSLLEWGGAQRWLKKPVTDAPLIRQLAASAGGHASVFRSSDKSVPVFTPLSAPLARIQRELKKQFDPQGIFNPGRLCKDW